MTFTIISHTPHYQKEGKLYAYAPYVREMNIWAKQVDKLVIVAPLKRATLSNIDVPYAHNQIKILAIPTISITSFSEILKALIVSPFILLQIFRGMAAANHIHLRCPGNIGLIGSLVQVFFPQKKKTAKYAGNWDPKSKQPLSYRFQKKLLSNPFWTKKMNVLVYGDWPNQTKNIKPFFTATYPKSKVTGIVTKEFKAPFQFLFVGSLSSGKRPLYCIQLVELLLKKGIEARLDFYGDGIERGELEGYILKNKLREHIIIHGNETSEIVEKAFQKSDFLLLPSKSEGWPKVVAEAMFWGCIPMVTKISCVPWMLGEGRRGILLDYNLKKDVAEIETTILNAHLLTKMSSEAQQWSHNYTLDNFEAEIKLLL